MTYLPNPPGRSPAGRLNDPGPPQRPGRPPEWLPRQPWQPGTPAPTPTGLDPWLEERLFEQRIVLLQGHLTPALATRTSAALLTLDATGSNRVRLHVTSPDGDLGAVFALIDTLDLMRVTVHLTVTGEIGGAALGLLTAVRRRAAYAHARFHLAEPHVAEIAGTADEILGETSRHLRELDDLVVRLSQLTGRTRAELERDLTGQRRLSAAEARDYGLIDEVVGAAEQR